MHDTRDAHDDGLADLRREFHEGEDWHLYRVRSYKDAPDAAPTGDCYAVRLSDRAGIYATVAGDNPAQLETALREQAALRASGRTPLTLADVKS